MRSTLLQVQFCQVTLGWGTIIQSGSAGLRRVLWGMDINCYIFLDTPSSWNPAVTIWPNLVDHYHLWTESWVCWWNWGMMMVKMAVTGPATRTNSVLVISALTVALSPPKLTLRIILILMYHLPSPAMLTTIISLQRWPNTQQWTGQ